MIIEFHLPCVRSWKCPSMGLLLRDWETLCGPSTFVWCSSSDTNSPVDAYNLPTCVQVRVLLHVRLRLRHCDRHAGVGIPLRVRGLGGRLLLYCTVLYCTALYCAGLTLVSWLWRPLCPRHPDGEAGLLDPPGLVLAQQVHQQQPPRQRRVQRGVAQPLQQIFLGWHKYFVELLVSGVMKVRCVNVQMKVFWEIPELLMAKSSAPECHECTIVAVSVGCSQPMVYALNMLYVSLSIHFPFLPVIIMKCLRV